MSAYDVTFTLPGFDPNLMIYQRPPGGYVVVWRLAAGLANAGLKVAVVAPNKFTSGQIVSSSKIPVYSSGPYDWSYLRSANVDLIDYSFYPQSSWHIATGWQTADSVISKKLEQKAQAAYLIQAEEDHPTFGGGAATATYSLPFDEWMCVSPKQLSRWPLAHVVTPGLDHETYHNNGGERRDMNSLLFHSSVNPQKGLRFALDITSRLSPKLTFRSYGPIPPSTPSHNSEHHSSFNDLELASFHRRTELFLLTSEMEGLSMPILESMATGNLIATSDRSGHVFPSGLVEEFAFGEVAGGVDAINRLFSLDPSEKKRRVRLGIEYAKPFTYERALKQFREAINI